ncbi:MAG: hypothetical protein H7232_06990 [Aeromicrobium sp.]|nr:hypothetical protein [Burkholderiales bacterium]
MAQSTRAAALEQSPVTNKIASLVNVDTGNTNRAERLAKLAMGGAPEILRSRPAKIDAAVLHQIRGALAIGIPQSIRIAFFDDADLLVQITRSERFSKGGTTYVGMVPGIAMSSVVIVEENGVLSGNVNVLGKKYQIRNVGAADHELRQIDVGALPPDHSALPLWSGEKSSPMRSRNSAPLESAIQTASDDGSLIDVMVVYTPSARISQGGSAAMNSLVNLAVAETNNAYANSLVKQRVRLVYAGEVNYAESDFATDLARLQGTTDGFMDAIHQLRDLYGADIVSLWGNYSGGCGLANLMLDENANFSSQGFHVVDRNCATSNLSFAHELGHNMGLQHDVFDGNAGTTVTPERSTVPTAINYAHGYVDLNNRFRSVMAISAQCDAQNPVVHCPRIPHFSNPQVTVGGAPTGNANAQEFRALNDTRDTTANFRASVNLAGAGTVIFSPARYVVTESVGAVTLLVTRHAGSTGAVSVSYATVAGSAVAGSDYVAQSGTLNWADGESGTKIITVQILQDRVLDGPKGFTVTIETLTGGVSTGAPGVTKASAVVEINDADADSFPPGCMLPLTGWTFPALGWSVATDTYFGASCSLKTNSAANSGSARIQFVGNFTAGTISFARRVSSQSSNDCLRFFIDGVEQNIGGTCASGLGASGETAWAMLSFNISVGAHTLVWSHEKDASGLTGAGAAWIDSVALPLGGAPQIQSAPPAGGFLNIPYSHHFAVGGSPTISYALLSPSLPDGLTLNTSTGVISGIPRALGTFSGFVRAFNDAFPPFAQQPFVISIVGAAPSAPVVDATLTDNSFVRISASPATSAGSAPITSYTATCNPGAITGTSATSTIEVAGLVNGVEYSCAITATNTYGSSTASAPAIVMPVATKPGAPFIGAAIPGNARAFIGFSPPVSDGGMAITTYTAVCDPGILAGIGNVSPVVVNNLTNGVRYDCAVTATNAVGMSVVSATAGVTPSTTTQLTLLGVVSRKSHGVTGAFELPIDTAPTIAGAVTVEPRSIGNGHQVVFRFNNTVDTRVSPIVLDAANRAVGASLLLSDTDVIVTIPSVADASRVAIFLNGVNGSSRVFSAALGFLVGDITNSYVVNASDINGVKARSGQMTTAGNFLFDLNANGSINASDIQMVKAQSGAVLP